ncbi:MAG TPA: hypothetical protein VHF89_10390 [Solirubrobacteraceae bacterium]|nr:hypothetical protein [Solirubrobacteraceae bacterium]
MRGRTVAAIAAIALFGAVSFLVARWLTTDGVERGKVERLLEAQGRGDVDGMVAELDRCFAPCRARMARLAKRLEQPGEELTIARYDSDTSRALGEERGPTRVVWFLGDDLPTVQCVEVLRRGNPLTGPTVTLLGLSAPIGREAPCRN